LTKVYPLRAFDIKNAELARAGRAVKAKAEEETVKEEDENILQADEDQSKKVKKKKKLVSEEMAEEFSQPAQAEPEGTEDFGEEAK